MLWRDERRTRNIEMERVSHSLVEQREEVPRLLFGSFFLVSISNSCLLHVMPDRMKLDALEPFSSFWHFLSPLSQNFEFVSQLNEMYILSCVKDEHLADGIKETKVHSHPSFHVIAAFWELLLSFLRDYGLILSRFSQRQKKRMNTGLWIERQKEEVGKDFRFKRMKKCSAKKQDEEVKKTRVACFFRKSATLSSQLFWVILLSSSLLQ
jgi:hypothetical protein